MAKSMDNKMKFINADDSKEELLRRAAQVAKDEELEIEWISAQDLASSKLEKESSVFVLDPFEGSHFEFLKDQKCRMFGPLCVISCIETRTSLPSASHPVYNSSMRGIVACCSSMAKKERQNIHTHVELMGGIVIRDFTDAVTHLIAGEVGSKKYSVACSEGKQVMTPDWVYAVWKESQNTDLKATDEQFNVYKCPIFKGCTISVTGIDAATRQDIKQLCNSNGGTYSGELNMNTCTHLLVNVPKGDKYEFARKWSIHCVSTQWFYDCIQTGFWLDESSYHTIAEDESHLSQSSSRLHISQTANSSILSKSRANRTNTKAAQAAYKSAQTRGDGGLIADSNKSKGNATLTSRNMSNNSSSTIDLDLDFAIVPGCMFLDGCTVFLSGFNGEVLDKLRKVVNSGGGTRFNMINEKVSHVVVGNKVMKDLDVLQKCDFHPHVVTAQWIIDSAKNGRQMPEYDYIHPDFKVDKEGTPIFKENQKPSDNTITGTNNIQSNNKNTSIHQKSFRPDHEDHLDDDEVFMQYTTQVDQMPSETSTLQQKTSETTLQNDGNGNHGDGNKDEDDTLDDGRLLAGHSFTIVHFVGEQVMHLTEVIEDLGGQVITDKLADFAVLPMNILCEKNVAKENVTFCWLEQSIQEGKLLDPDSCFLFRCFVIDDGVVPLKGCVLTISQYIGAERDHLMQLAELLGAKCQEHFVLKPSRKFLASTHLLCEEPTGNKYQAALKWNIPVSNKYWLFACAKEQSLQPVENFPVTSKPATAVNQHRESVDGKMNDEVVQASLEKREENKESVATPIIQSKNPHPSGNNTALSRSTAASLKMPFRPSFDLADAMEELESPLVPSLRSRKSRASRNSFQLDDFFQEHIQQAVKRTGVGMSSLVTSEQDDRIENNEDNEDQQDDNGILHGVILAVSKKLNSQQTELYGIASSLGANYRWVFDMTCTHLVHQGRANDNTKEYSMARDNGKSIVSPHWLHACAEANTRLDEKLYPHTYNPKMSLKGVTKGRRLTRSSKNELDISIQNDVTKAASPAIKPSEKQNSEERATSGSASLLSEESRESSTKETSQKNDSEGQSDPKQDLQKQIENFMSSTKGLKGRRRSRRQTSSNSTSSNSVATLSNEGENDSRSSNSYSLRLRNHYDQREPDKSARNDRKHSDDIEPSQSDTITYDDPAGRLERERIMARLKNGCSPSPSPDDTTQDQQEDYDDDGDDQKIAEELANFTKDHPSLGEQVANEVDDKDTDSSQNTQTPVAPPLALQVKEVDKPTPQNLLKDFQDVSSSKSKVFKFHLSAMTPQEKIEYSGLIEQLGGEVFDTQYFKTDCSHVVVGKPNRNEKYLAAIAAGKWVLHNSFLEDSRQAGHFVDEESHEWGIEIPGEQPNKLAMAARRWRLKLKEKRLNSDDDSIGAFSGWSVLLCVDKQRQPGFKRLLEAGGASVVGSQPPFNNIDNVSHAFIDYNKLKPGTLDIEALYKAGIWLVKPDYIAEFLMQDPEPHPARYLIPVAAKLYQADGNASAQRKRKGDELSADEKRLRIE